MMIGSMRHASASAPANPFWLCVWSTTALYTKSPITIDGTPVMISAKNLSTRAMTPRRPYSLR